MIFRVRGVITKLSFETDCPEDGNGNGMSAAMGGFPIRRGNNDTQSHSGSAMNTLGTNVQRGLIIGAGAFPEARTATKEKLTRAASPAKLPYGMAPEDRKTEFFKQACYWTFMLIGAYSLIRAFVI